MRAGSIAVAALAVLGPLAGAQPRGWEPREIRTFEAKDLYGHIDGGAEIFLEFGFEKLAVEYLKRDAYELEIEVYSMDGPEGALGIYLNRCRKETRVLGLAVRHTGNALQITALKGRSLLVVSNPGGDPALLPDMVTIINRRIEKIPDESPRDLIGLLPKDGLVEGTQILIRGNYGLEPLITLGRGDILGLGGKRFGVKADYTDEKGRVHSRIFVDYGEASTARGAYLRLAQGLDPELKILDQGSAGLTYRDFKGEIGRIRLDGSVLEIRYHLPQSSVP